MKRPRFPRPVERYDSPGCSPVLLFIFLLSALLLAGCAHRRVDWTRTVTTHPDNTVVEQNHVIYDNVGFDTQAGVVTLGRDGHGNPTLHMENLKAEDMTARAALEIARTAAAFAPASVGGTP